MASIIRVENLCKTYENEGVKTHAVCGVSLTIQKGEFVAIMGPSGSGKSTLMQMLGFLDHPTEGQYFFDEEDTASFSEEKLAHIRNQKIGFVFQTFNLLPRTTVFENVELPLLYDRGETNKKEARKKVEKALQSVFIEYRINYFSSQLSGGEKQRVAIARALVNNPDVIFADEPTGNLDSKSGIQIMKILQELNKEGHTIILVTHETFTAQHAQRIVYIRDGQIVADDIVKDRRVAEDGELLK
jgi:putative ABC transport system ATP-binding protein